MAGYTKLHSKIVLSSIWRQPHHVRVVWITMLAMANYAGVVEGSVRGMAHIAGVTIDEFIDAMRILCGPDPDSSDGTTGERIEVVPGGWFIINHTNYRDRQTKEQVDTMNRVRRYRERKKTKAGETDSGYVYYVKSGDLMKIGFSSSPSVRFSEIQTANPLAEMVVMEDGNLNLEKERHRQFSHLSVSHERSREWFRYEGDLAAFVRDLLKRSVTQSNTPSRASVYVSVSESTDGSTGTERKKRGRKPTVAAKPDDVDQQVWDDWLALRAQKKAPASQTALKRLRIAAEEAGLSLSGVMEICVQNGWQGFQASWLAKNGASKGVKGDVTRALWDGSTANPDFYRGPGNESVWGDERDD